MKTRIIITAIGVATLAALNLIAGEALLSPKAKANQIAVASNVSSGPNLAAANRDRIGSPRALANETVAGGTEVTAAPTKCAVVGTPRQSEMFGSCCKVAKTNCKAATGCCAK